MRLSCRSLDPAELKSKELLNRFKLSITGSFFDQLLVESDLTGYKSLMIEATSYKLRFFCFLFALLFNRSPTSQKKFSPVSAVSASALGTCSKRSSKAGRLLSSTLWQRRIYV